MKLKMAELWGLSHLQAGLDLLLVVGRLPLGAEEPLLRKDSRVASLPSIVLSLLGPGFPSMLLVSVFLPS